ncbi:rhomboid-like protein 11, chloroplastic [Rosa sericea]
MGQFQVHRVQTLTKPQYSYSSPHPIPITCFPRCPNLTLTFPHSLSTSQNHPKPLHLPLRPLLTAVRSRIVCKSSGSEFDILAQPEERRRPHRRANGIFWILLINIGIYLADHIFQVRAVKMLYLYHSYPEWFQFLTATFCHANWNHLSSNLFFLYIFGKLVEEDEGNFALWLSYILTGVGANFVSWLVLPTNAVSIGASGAVFGLFTISVLVKMSWDWRKILEVLILGQFVIDKVMEAAQASTGLAGRGGSSLMNVNHIAHLSGALVGVFIVWLLGRIPSEPPEQGGLDLKKK